MLSSCQVQLRLYAYCHYRGVLYHVALLPGTVEYGVSLHPGTAQYHVALVGKNEESRDPFNESWSVVATARTL